MKKVKAIRFFHDLLENKDRYANDEFECSEERYNFLKENNAVELINEPNEEVIEEIVEEKPKKTSKKKSK